MGLYIGLVHYPVYNKNHKIIASAITTVDIHDIARLARTYDVKKFFVITPLDDQRALAARILRHWTRGYGSGYNKHRKEALELVSVVSTLEQVKITVSEIDNDTPLILATDASEQNGSIPYSRARSVIGEGRPVILLFGTAWGLHGDIIENADYMLEPVWGRTDYNHLSVRSAAAIILDRLMGSSR